MLREKTITPEKLATAGWKFDQEKNAWLLGDAELVHVRNRWRLTCLKVIVSGICRFDELDLILERIQATKGKNVRQSMSTIKRDVTRQSIQALGRKPMQKPRPIADYFSAIEGAKE